MSKTQSPATIIAQACAALAQVSQQLASAVQMMNGENEGSAEPKRRGRPPAAAKVAEPEKKAVTFSAAEIQKIQFLIETGTEKQEAMRKVFNLRGGKKVAPTAAPAKAPVAKTPTVKVAPKPAKRAIKMITREDVENDSYTLAEFRAHLKENGIEKGTDDYAALNTKFLELRKKFKDEIEEENSVGEPEMTDDDQLMGEFQMGEDSEELGEFSFTE